jgi:hypothetical protein
MIMNENIFRTGPPAWSLRAAERVDGSGAPGSSAGGDRQAFDPCSLVIFARSLTVAKVDEAVVRRRLTAP